MKNRLPGVVTALDIRHIMTCNTLKVNGSGRMLNLLSLTPTTVPLLTKFNVHVDVHSHKEYINQ